MNMSVQMSLIPNEFSNVTVFNYVWCLNKIALYSNKDTQHICIACYTRIENTSIPKHKIELTTSLFSIAFPYSWVRIAKKLLCCAPRIQPMFNITEKNRSHYRRLYHIIENTIKITMTPFFPLKWDQSQRHIAYNSIKMILVYGYRWINTHICSSALLHLRFAAIIISYLRSLIKFHLIKYSVYSTISYDTHCKRFNCSPELTSYIQFLQ